MTARAAVVAEARSWLGTPWAHQHRVKGVSVDCAGLIIGVARALGLVPECFDVNGYSRQPDGTLLDTCAAQMWRIDREQMQPGDVLVLATEREPHHMGIIGDYPRGGLSLIHATNAGRCRVVEHRLQFGPRLKFRAAFSLPGVA